MEKRYIFTIVRKHDMIKGETWRAIWDIFAWSMNIMLYGQKPDPRLVIATAR